jgi:hypothetical protein
LAYIACVVAVVLLSLLLVACGCSGRSGSSGESKTSVAKRQEQTATASKPRTPQVAQPRPPDPFKTVGNIKALDREAVRTLLKRLAETKVSVPDQPNVSACCYAPMELPKPYIWYTCPKCGEKTLYEQGMAYLVESELPACRAIIKMLERRAPGAFKLDESRFCRECSPAVKQPTLVLTLNYADGKPQTISGVTPEETRLLQEFLSGELVHKDAEGSKLELRYYLPQIEKIVGEKRK